MKTPQGSSSSCSQISSCAHSYTRNSALAAGVKYLAQGHADMLTEGFISLELCALNIMRRPKSCCCSSDISSQIWFQNSTKHHGRQTNSQTNQHVRINMSSWLLLLQCAVWQLCAGEPCNERWHNSPVNHPLQHSTAVQWWSLLLHSEGSSG